MAGPTDPDPGLDGVEWLGPKTRSELYRDLYPEGDVFVHPPNFDTAAMVVQEAVAHGMPVIAPSSLCLPELVRDGETGLLFPDGDVDAATDMTRRLLDDRALRARMSQAAVEDFSERFSADVRNHILGAAYRSVVAA